MGHAYKWHHVAAAIIQTTAQQNDWGAHKCTRTHTHTHRCATHYTQRTFMHTALSFCIFPCARHPGHCHLATVPWARAHTHTHTHTHNTHFATKTEVQ